MEKIFVLLILLGLSIFWSSQPVSVRDIYFSDSSISVKIPKSSIQSTDYEQEIHIGLGNLIRDLQRDFYLEKSREKYSYYFRSRVLSDNKYSTGIWLQRKIP